VTLAVEFLKLIIATFIYFRWNDGLDSSQKWAELGQKWRLFAKFGIPACMYGVYNALAFYAIQMIGPGPYRLLINLKVITSGIVLYFLGMKRLSSTQWCALFLLVLACFIERYDSVNVSDLGLLSLGIIFVQCMCSSMAGVANQKLLATERTDSEDKRNRDTWQRNVMMYVWTCFLNTAWLLLWHPSVFTFKTLKQTLTLRILPIVLSSTFTGFATSLLLSFYDVILKEYANFVELVLTVIGAYMIFGTQLKWTLLLAVLIAGFSLIQYTQEEERLAKVKREEETRRKDTEMEPSSSV